MNESQAQARNYIREAIANLCKAQMHFGCAPCADRECAVHPSSDWSPDEEEAPALGYLAESSLEGLRLLEACVTGDEDAMRLAKGRAGGVTLHLDSNDKFQGLIEALDQYTQNTAEALEGDEESSADARYLGAAEEMLEYLNAHVAALAEGVD